MRDGVKPDTAQLSHVENVNVADAPKMEHRDIETCALVVDAAKSDFKLTSIILDEIRPNEMLISMQYSGICHTVSLTDESFQSSHHIDIWQDIVLQQGLLPMIEFTAIFGHEGAGTVLGISSAVKNNDLRVDDAVILSFNICGSCRACPTKKPANCHVHPEVNHNAVRLSDRSMPARLKDGTNVRSQYFRQSSFAKMSVVNEKCVVKCPREEDMAV